jgi:hypothetical protein
MSTQQQNLQQQQKVQNQQQQQPHHHEQHHEQQRWRNEGQYNKGKKEGLSREQIEAGTADVGYATTHAGYPEEARGGNGGRIQDTQAVRVNEQQYQQSHHLTKDNMIGSELKGPSEVIRESHGLKPEGEQQACPSCNQKSCSCEGQGLQQQKQQNQQQQQQNQQEQNFQQDQQKQQNKK